VILPPLVFPGFITSGKFDNF